MLKTPDNLLIRLILGKASIELGYTY